MSRRAALICTGMLLVAGCESQNASSKSVDAKDAAAKAEPALKETLDKSQDAPAAEDAYPIHGMVSLDGRPLDGVEVVFLRQSVDGKSPSSQPSAITDAKGGFRLKWPKGSDADSQDALVGKYKVIIRAGPSSKPVVDQGPTNVDDLPRAEPKGPEISTPRGLPRAYSDQRTTPFTVDVLSGANEFRIELNSQFGAPSR